jgi:hypothetical protein
MNSYYGGVIGMQVEDLSAERARRRRAQDLEALRRAGIPRRELADFEIEERGPRVLWTDKSSGTTYRSDSSPDPLLQERPEHADVDYFVVDGAGAFHYLRQKGKAAKLTEETYLGEVVAGELVGHGASNMRLLPAKMHGRYDGRPWVLP